MILESLSVGVGGTKAIPLIVRQARRRPRLRRGWRLLHLAGGRGGRQARHCPKRHRRYRTEPSM